MWNLHFIVINRPSSAVLYSWMIVDNDFNEFAACWGAIHVLELLNISYAHWYNWACAWCRDCSRVGLILFSLSQITSVGKIQGRGEGNTVSPHNSTGTEMYSCGTFPYLTICLSSWTSVVDGSIPSIHSVLLGVPLPNPTYTKYHTCIHMSY